MTEERPLALLAFVAVGAVLLSCAGVYVATNRWNSSDVTAAGFTRGSGGGEAETLRVLQEEVQRETAARAEASRALAKARAGELLAKAAEAQRTLKAAGDAFAKWDELVLGLLSSEAGRRVASEPERVVQFSALHNRLGRPSQDGLAAIEARVAALEENLRKVEKSDEPTLPPDVAKQYEEQLGEDQQAAQMVLRALQDGIGAVEGLVADAEGDRPATATLGEAVRALEAERGRNRAAAIAKVHEEVAAEQLALDEQMERELQEKLAVADREGRRVELEDEARQKATAAELTEREAQERDIKTRAEDPAVLALYEPFLGLGKTQPWNSAPSNNDHCNWRVDPEALEPQPVSMFYLRKSGALDRFPTFVAFATSSAEEKNDRGAWPPHGGDEETVAKYRKRWEEFKELAETWVEMGKLKK